jgi:hypothetical protein
MKATKNTDENTYISPEKRLNIASQCGYLPFSAPRYVQQEIARRKYQIGNIYKDSFITSAFLTISYIHFLNALQYYFTALTVERNSNHKPQVEVLLYYAKFYSILSLLESHFKGFMTLRLGLQKSTEKSTEKSPRSKVYIVDIISHEYRFSESKPNTHELTAKWFFGNLLKKCKELPNFNDIRVYSNQDSLTSFTNWRNDLNYGLFFMLDELYWNHEVIGNIPNYIIKGIWDDSLPKDIKSDLMGFESHLDALLLMKAASHAHKSIFSHLIKTNPQLIPEDFLVITHNFLVFHKNSEYREIVLHILNDIGFNTSKSDAT